MFLNAQGEMKKAERKRAEAELRRSHTFLRQVIDTDPNFIFAKDREGRFTLANKAVAAAYGVTVDELLGKYVLNALLQYEEVIATTDTPKEQVQKLIESAMDAVHQHRAALLLLQQDGRWLAEQPRFSYLNEVGLKIETLWRNTVQSGIDAGVFNPEIVVPFVTFSGALNM